MSQSAKKQPTVLIMITALNNFGLGAKLSILAERFKRLFLLFAACMHEINYHLHGFYIVWQL